ncbi:hypothetical protein Purlil1_13775 [Purpureocillium lilacinum]|uniref:AB hydrolase-1 domain-containing protein n=1 Tax=Purpureocillium lilacinum TaxID=33203 RepID=A0ABR0BD27_PURLI|nr:hypothetical protein Purlil1_13775 [Purpureocillium lilacinum]
MEWLGRAKTHFTHAPSPRPVRQTDGTETDLLKICESTTPSCHLSPLLFNGHLQTMWTAVKPSGPPVFYRRKVFDADHKTYKGIFAVDFAVEPFEEMDETLPRNTVYFTDEQLRAMPSDDSKPMLVVLHGLSGGSHEVYLRQAIAPLLGRGGWEVCVVNSRGCARSNIASGVLYNARATWDVRQTIKWLHKNFPRRPLFGMGFSQGANMLTNYCGEEGDDCLLKAVVVVSNPFNLEICSKMLQNNLLGRELYLRVMGTMKRLITAHWTEMQKSTDLDPAVLETITYLHEFDREVQCPTWGYPTEYAYYRDASSTDAVLGIQVPFIAINAADDPIALNDALPYEEFRQNPNTILITTSLGGHLAWFESGGTRWYPRPICNFLNHMAFNVDLDSIQVAQKRHKAPMGAGYDPMRRKLAIV